VISRIVLLPFTVSLPRAVPAEGIDLRGKVHSLVCSAVICVSQQASFDLHLAEGAAPPSMDSGLFASAHEAESRSSPSASTISTEGLRGATGSAR
jgi:DsbC/DsbD-like thiol-disulfide interchange protein